MQDPVVCRLWCRDSVKCTLLHVLTAVLDVVIQVDGGDETLTPEELATRVSHPMTGNHIAWPSPSWASSVLLPRSCTCETVSAGTKCRGYVPTPANRGVLLFAVVTSNYRLRVPSIDVLDGCPLPCLVHSTLRSPHWVRVLQPLGRSGQWQIWPPNLPYPAPSPVQNA